MNAEVIAADGRLVAYVDGEVANEFSSLDDAKTWADSLGIDAVLPEFEPAPVVQPVPQQSGNLAKGAIIVAVVVVVFALFPRSEQTSPTPSAPASQWPATRTKQWYEGGSLHNASMAEWNRAEHANKLATAADWLAATTWRGHLTNHESFDRLKAKARTLVWAMDGAHEPELADVLTAKEIAAIFIASSNDLGP